MQRRVRYVSALFAAALAFVVGTSTAHAVLDKNDIACLDALGKEGLKFASGLLKQHQKCNDAELKSAGSCAAPDPAAITKLETKLASGIAKKCTFPATEASLANIGFPGACLDPTPLSLFTLADLQDCIKTSHTSLVNNLLAVEYDSTLVSPLPADQLACQKEIAKNSAKLVSSVHKAIQKCRSGINKGKITGVLPAKCQINDQKTVDAVAKAVANAQAKIAAKCPTDPLVTALKVCTPDQVTSATAVSCEIDAHLDATDNPTLGHVATFIDFEYATPAVCGDNVVNRPNEECDGTDDSACPNLCGPAAGPTPFFACLCTDIPRQRVVEHSNADLDNGWSGKSHDSGIVEGGGWVTELHDCDNVGDFDCNSGPTCSLAPHSSCSATFGAPYTTGNSICAGLSQGVCRRTRAGTTGPHCELDFDQECLTNAQCPGFKDRCVKVSHGPPLPLSAGGISVCLENIFSEDVVGTVNLATGASSVRLRQLSITHLGPIDQPCPVCSGFCSGNLGAGNTVGARNRCTNDSDCPGSFCVTDNICSFGPNADKACRTTAPFGGPSEFFGTSSVDCPPNIADIGQLDILFNPASTAVVSQQSSVVCNAAGFTGKTCFQGTNDGRDCTVDGDCPGGGTCINQCWCPNQTATTKPNACDPACKGGANLAAPCTVDSECPGGFCHEADCSLDGLDNDSAQEGVCTVGPSTGSCSITKFKGCTTDVDCQTGCTFCQPAETCIFTNQSCFVNNERFRAGSPGVPERVSAALFCIPQSGDASLNNTAGLPGPGAITQPARTYETGF